MQSNRTFTYGLTPDAVVAEAFEATMGDNVYRIVLRGSDEALADMVPDALLFGADMVAVCSALMADGSDLAMDFRSSLLSTIGIEEV